MLRCPVLAAEASAPPVPAVSASTGAFIEVDRLYLQRQLEGNLERSNALLEERLRSASDDPDALWRLGRGLTRLAERRKAPRERLELFERARLLLERSLSLREASADAHFWLGLALGRVGQTRGMLRSLFLVGPIKENMRRAIALDPGHGGAHHVLGEMLRQLPGFAGGSKKRAISELETAVRLSPDWTANYPALAEAYLDAGERAKAVETLRRAFAVTAPADPGEHEENLQDARGMLLKLGEKP
ncbi:MAG: hypothetical protein WC969_06735 [Elusimicrobiota bacterium]